MGQDTPSNEFIWIPHNVGGGAPGSNDLVNIEIQEMSKQAAPRMLDGPNQAGWSPLQNIFISSSEIATQNKHLESGC